MPQPPDRHAALFLDPLGEGTYAMDEDRGIQAVVDIYVQSGQLSKAEADLAVASSLTVVGAREQLNAAVREKMNADSIGGIQAAADSFVQSGKLSKGQADLAVASSLTVAGAQRKLNAAVNKQKQLKKKAEKEKKEKAKMEEKEKAKMEEKEKEKKQASWPFLSFSYSSQGGALQAALCDRLLQAEGTYHVVGNLRLQQPVTKRLPNFV